jgi:hypothetical protein
LQQTQAEGGTFGKKENRMTTIAELERENQEAFFREHMRKYAYDILPKAGMLPTEGIGGAPEKLFVFACLSANRDVEGLTGADCEVLLQFLDAFLAKYGAEALVEYIDRTISVAQIVHAKRRARAVNNDFVQ